MRVPLHASATDGPLPRFGMSRIGLGHLLAVAILIGPNRSTTIGLPLASLPCTPVAARLVVSPDDVRDVGVRNERYDAVRPSGSGVGSEIDNGHSKSSLCSSWPKTQLSFVIEVAKWIDPKVGRIRRRVVLIFAFGMFPSRFPCGGGHIESL